MKRIIVTLIIAGFSLLAGTSKAQTALSPAADTLTNAQTRDLTVKLPGTYNNALTFQVDVTKISGTTALKAYMYASVNGVSYAIIPATDSLVNTDGSASKQWVLNKSNYLFYKIRTVGTGTQSTRLAGVFVAR